MGKEFYDKGANVQLGPGLCLARVPRNGRNFEYLSGEDPYLGYGARVHPGFCRVMLGLATLGCGWHGARFFNMRLYSWI
jgi:hypothetical protein